jgi:hypothetical protein
MYVRRNFDIKGLINFTGFHIIWRTAYSIFCYRNGSGFMGFFNDGIGR